MIGLASNEGRKTGSLSDLESYKLTQDCKIHPSRRVIPAKNIFTCHENDCHVLDHMFRLHFDTVPRSSVRKCNVNLLLNDTVHVHV